MRELISFSLFFVLMLLAAGSLIIMIRNELENKKRTTGGYGLVPAFGFLVVFFVMPVFAYFIRF